MLSLLVFLGISVSTIFAMSTPIIQHIKITRDAYTSKQSYYAAESLNEDIIYRLNHIMDVSTNETLTVGDADVEATVTNISGGKEITITIKSGKVWINGSAMVETADVISSNGVTHVINAVLMPK